MTNPQSALDEQAAEAYREELFKLNPDGFTCAPYVNALTIDDAFLAGAKFARQAAERDVAELVEALGSLASNICSPVSMTDARSQLSELETELNRLIAKHLARGG